MFGDCHVHLLLDGIYYKTAIAAHRGHVRDDLIRPELRAYADKDITFLRDGGDAFGVGERARQLAPEYGIEYRSPIFPICLKDRYGEFIGVPFHTLSEYRGLVAEVKRRGGDFVKIMISGLMDFNRYGVITSQPLDRATIGEMIRIAHGEGFAVMAHANGAQTVMDALEMGVDSIEHGAYLTPEAVCALAQAGAVWVPTLSTIGNLVGDGRFPDAVLTRILDLHLANVAECVRLGGRVALGSDAGAYRVRHAQGACDEYGFLRRALGDAADAALSAGEVFVRERFRVG